MQQPCHPMKTYRTGLRALLCAAIGLAASSAEARVFRWVDSAGQVHYSDRVPADEGIAPREELSRGGQVIKAVTAPPSSEEEKAKQQASEEARLRAQAEKLQEQHDMALLKTFGSVDELELAKQQRLEQIDGKIRAAGDQAAALQAQISNLESRAAQGDPRLPKNYKDEVEALNKAIATARITAERGHEERRQAEASFDADLARLRALKSPVGNEEGSR